MGWFDELMLSAKKFDEFLHKSRKGNKITYYRGYIFDPTLQRLGATQDRERVKKFARHVMNAYDKGLVTLVQKRHDDFDYEYMAIRL
jgi:nitrous oxidase accessory protein NosD